MLIVGGREGNRLIEVPEVFDPRDGVFITLSMAGATPRASHTATLLTDGRVLVVGGSNGGDSPVDTEIWDVQAHEVTATQAPINRVGQSATITADGRVLVTGGTLLDGTSSPGPIVVDPIARTAHAANAQSLEQHPAMLAASIPENGASSVPIDVRPALRFSEVIAFESLNSQTVSLRGPAGPVPVTLVPAEGGRLAFVWPSQLLEAGATYVLAVSGVVDSRGVSLPAASVTFSTAPAVTTDAPDNEEWSPNSADKKNGWQTGRPASPWATLAPLTAPAGVTAISGQALTLDGRPLVDATLSIEDDVATATTDKTGRFLLIPRTTRSGHHVLIIDGRTANRPKHTYGLFEWGLDIVPGQTSTLRFTIWMPALDVAHAVPISSPTTQETVVTSPLMPGLELHLPAGTVIRDRTGAAVRSLTLTPIPLDRTPFPLPGDATFTMDYTIQPGGAYVYTPDSKGAWVVYPSKGSSGPVGKRVQFYTYDPDDMGWAVYGMGTVGATQVIPDPGTRIYQFTGASFNDGNTPPPAGAGPDPQPRADPVDPSTGAFIMPKTDLYVADVIPLSVTRTYNAMDPYARPFGTGMTHAYAIFQHTEHLLDEADLILPDGFKVHYVRISPDGLPWYSVVMQNTVSPNEFYKSLITFNFSDNGWNLTLTNGTVYVFGHEAPLQKIRDRYGNEVRLTWSGTNTFGAGVGNLTRVTSPNGRWIDFTYYTGTSLVYQAKDNIGRTVTYMYDGAGNLSTVTDPESGVTTYTYDTSKRLLTITDGRSITYLTNQYDTSGRISQQTLADPSATYGFSYTTDGSGNITQADVTDPRGHVERLAFDANHYVTSDTQAYGTSLARTTTSTRQTGSNLLTAVVDGLSRRTEYTYDSNGHVLTRTQLAGTGDAVTTTSTYEPLFGQLATVTDPLSHTWTTTYDSIGRVSAIIDPLAHQSTIAMNGAGQVTSVTDPLSHTWQLGYTGGDVTSATDPLGASRSRFVDAAGRLVSQTDALGRVTQVTVDNLSRTTAVVDPIGAQTAFGYDANSNLLSLTDALTQATTYAYDNSDRVETRTDPLTHAASYVYDLNSNLTQVTDRKSQVTSSTYDELDRLTGVTFDDSSTITYTYDAGDRLTEIDDSANGTITRTYDNLDRLTEETTPQGTVDYTYDADGRRATMTVAGQTAVAYAYDDAHGLTSITQGTSVVALTYDAANRRSTLTFPNGIVATSGYDGANQLTSLTYSLSGTTLGDLTYTYDAAGQRTSVGGSWARTGMPSALTSATYDAANRIASWGGTSFSYDLNGNLTGDGTNTYTWNARNQLAGLSGGASASFAYDGVGRRFSKTISSATAKFLYDGPNLVQEQTSGGTPTANLMTGLGIDETFTRTDVAGTSTLLTDALDSVLELADATGTLQTHYTFEPFGTTTSSGTSSTNAQQFTGRENDGTPLYFARARYYSPATGRFVSEDPIGLRGGLNVYRYVSDAPTIFTDPTGLDQTIWDFGGNGRWGPRNGNWGGGNWSGGWVPSEHGGDDGPLPPTDSADDCYRDHDKCYEKCKNKRDCDRELVRCLERLPDDPRQWPRPPRPGTEGNSSSYRRRAIIVFRWW